ncbi:hypothetical protein D3C87_1753010 [compost metagenome]
MRAMGRENLSTVDDEVFAILARAGFELCHRRTRFRLAHAQSHQTLTREEIIKKTLFEIGTGVLRERPNSAEVARLHQICRLRTDHRQFLDGDYRIH